GLLAYSWSKARPGHALVKFAVVHALELIGVLLSGTLIPGYGILELMATKQKDFIGMATEVASGSLIAIPTLEPNLLSFVTNVPSALYMTFFSPFAVLGNGALAWMGAGENVLLLLLPLIAWRYKCPWSQVDKPALLLCASFILLLALLIGLTVPVVGALVRYRIPLLPIAGVLVMLLIDPERLPRWMRSPSNT
ncbi:MAG TPA: hypothetical protein PK760_03425, partial [Flavobacteriales bacterium]|nr:hypothetical protein [Flavobacteriales bacterium]